MAHSTTASHAHIPHLESEVEHTSRTVESDPGPWLALTGPVLIAMTVIAVSWLSRISF